MWRSVDEAAKLLTVETVTQPIPENVEIYDRILRTYSGLYGDLKQRFRARTSRNLPRRKLFRPGGRSWFEGGRP